MGSQEILLIVLVLVLLFGASRLPQLGEGLGRAVRNFKRYARGDNEIDVTPPEKLPESTPAPRAEERPDFRSS